MAPDPPVTTAAQAPPVAPPVAPPRRRLRRALARLAALVGSLVVALVLGEVAVRFAAPQNLSGSWRVRHPRGYLVNKSGGTSRHQLGDRVVCYRFNTLHQRGGEVAPHDRRALLLGDSYTFGWLLDEAAGYVALLQAAADRDCGAGTWQVLNGGAGGWGTADYVAYVEDFGEQVRPRLVVAFLNADDVRRSVESPVYRLSDDGRSLQSGTPPPEGRLKRVLNGLPGYQFGLEHSHLLQLTRKALLRGDVDRDRGRQTAAAGRTPDEARAANDRGVRLARLLFARLRDWCDGHGARLVVLTTGFRRPVAEVVGGGSEPDENAAFLNDAAAIFAAERIPFHALEAGVARDVGADWPRFTIPGDGHPNEAGAALIARHAWAVLKPYFDGGSPPPAVAPRD
jgi:GDSL-like Lipase/Acylhydrolase family